MDYLILAGGFFLLYLVSLAFAQFMDATFAAMDSERQRVKERKRG